MTHDPIRRRLLSAAVAGAGAASAPSLLAATPRPAARDPQRPFRIYAITFRGMTDVEKGFEEYFASRKIPVQITYRDLNREATRMPGFLDEIRATRPDLVYTWGTSVTLGVVGPHDAVQAQHISDIPVVFTLVAAPVQHIGKLLVLWRPPADKARAEREDRKPGPRTVKLVKPSKHPARAPTARKVKVLGNQRVTAGGLIKRARPAPRSAKKKAAG